MTPPNSTLEGIPFSGLTAQDPARHSLTGTYRYRSLIRCLATLRQNASSRGPELLYAFSCTRRDDSFTFNDRSSQLHNIETFHQYVYD